MPEPDVLVCHVSDLTPRNLPVAPLLAVGVLTPSTRLVDLNLERARCEAAGCSSYWVVDPTAPSITAWELRDGEYVEVAAVTGGELFTAAHPCPVALAPRELVD